jgi:hypothetical protein
LIYKRKTKEILSLIKTISQNNQMMSFYHSWRPQANHLRIFGNCYVYGIFTCSKEERDILENKKENASA